MDIGLSLKTRLFDNDYGFSALLEKYDNKLTDEAKKEIKELIEEDIIFMVEQCEWNITEISERQESTEHSEQHDSKALHIADVSNIIIAYFKWLEGKQLTANHVLEIETFAKEYIEDYAKELANGQKQQKLKAKLALDGVRRSALRWWNNLGKHQQNDLERETFGDGEPWEDNTLNENDIIHMYKRHYA